MSESHLILEIFEGHLSFSNELEKKIFLLKSVEIHFEIITFIYICSRNYFYQSCFEMKRFNFYLMSSEIHPYSSVIFSYFMENKTSKNIVFAYYFSHSLN